MGMTSGCVTINWPIDKLIAIPPTSGIAPLCSFLSLGLSTKPTTFATFRIKKSEEKEKKPTNDSSNNMINSSQYFV